MNIRFWQRGDKRIKADEEHASVMATLDDHEERLGQQSKRIKFLEDKLGVIRRK